jgi:hypothetical protein
MQGVGDGGDEFRRIPERRSSLSHPDRQVAAFDELRHDETKSVFRATHIEDRHDVGMVQLGEDAGLAEIGLDILIPGDSFRIGHLDGHWSIDVVVMGQIDPAEPSPAQQADHPITADLSGLAGWRRAGRAR